MSLVVSIADKKNRACFTTSSTYILTKTKLTTKKTNIFNIALTISFSNQLQSYSKFSKPPNFSVLFYRK